MPEFTPLELIGTRDAKAGKPYLWAKWVRGLEIKANGTWHCDPSERGAGPFPTVANLPVGVGEKQEFVLIPLEEHDNIREGKMAYKESESGNSPEIPDSCLELLEEAFDGLADNAPSEYRAYVRDQIKKKIGGFEK